MSHPKTLGELKESGYQPCTVKQEMRRNLINKLRKHETIFPGIVGYDDTVIPQVIHAILSKHDMIFLGLRGQAKTRMIRALPSLLNEWIPILDGSEVADSPFVPISKWGQNLVRMKEDGAPIAWLHREERYTEKLATPDVTIADIIGDIDPIKAAKQKLDLSSEEALNYGLVPRANRGIFAINEIPDLSPKIQVGLFNIMQERDVQIRGMNVRLPLDLVVVFSANPQDYTNRGRIVTPLKDRIGSEIRTHYPLTREQGMVITDQEADFTREDGTEVVVPTFMKKVIEEVARAARESKDIEQASGVSARMSITCMENVISSAERRAIVNNESIICPRASDLLHIHPAMTGKLELSYTGEERGAEMVARRIIRQAIQVVFAEYFGHDDCQSTVDWFHEDGHKFQLSDALDARQLCENAQIVHGLVGRVKAYLKEEQIERPEIMASGIEFMLEGLYAHKRLSKTEVDGGVSYS